MAEKNDVGMKGFTASAAITQHARVTLASGKVAAAGETVKEIGTATAAAFADGDLVNVDLRTKPGTVKMIASEAIGAEVDVWTAGSGKVQTEASAGTGSLLVGTSIQAASGDGSVIEVLRHSHGDSAHA